MWKKRGHYNVLKHGIGLDVKANIGINRPVLTQMYDNEPSSSEDGTFPIWSNGPVRRTKSVFRESVVTQ